MQRLDFDPDTAATPSTGLVQVRQGASRTLWAGLDVGRHRTHLCVTGEDGTVTLEASCQSKTCDIAATLSSFPVADFGLVAVESGVEPFLVRGLRAHGYPVAIFEARKASKFLAIRRNKTDSGDAKGLADLGRLGRHAVSQVHLKGLDCQRLRSTLATRHLLIRLRVAAELMIRSQLAQHGRGFRKSTAQGAVRKEVERQLASLLVEEGLDLSSDLEPLVAASETIRAQLQAMDAGLKRFAAAHPVCRRLMQVPGVGTICSLSFYSAIEDPRRFRRASDVAAYMGLVPRRYQSGETSRTLGITKTGNRLTRTHLVSSAMILSSRGRDCALKRWAGRLKDRIGPGRSNVALARKLAILLLSLWRDERDFVDFPEGQEIFGAGPGFGPARDGRADLDSY